jgi:hypothetical protein
LVRPLPSAFRGNATTRPARSARSTPPQARGAAAGCPSVSPLQRELPGEDARSGDRDCRNRCPEQVVIGRIRQSPASRPLCYEVEQHRRNEQCDWKMDQHHMLCVLGQERRLEIEWIYHHPSPSKIWRRLLPGTLASATSAAVSMLFQVLAALFNLHRAKRTQFVGAGDLLAPKSPTIRRHSRHK